MKVFVDSNVFISYFQDEFGGGLEFMSYRTAQFLDRTLSCTHNIIISNHVLMEICAITLSSEKEMLDELSHYSDKIKIVNETETDIKNAEILNSKYHVGKADCLFFIIAEREKCECIVTWNKKHFNLFNNKIRILDPSEL